MSLLGKMVIIEDAGESYDGDKEEAKRLLANYFSPEFIPPQGIKGRIISERKRDVVLVRICREDIMDFVRNKSCGRFFSLTAFYVWREKDWPFADIVINTRGLKMVQEYALEPGLFEI